MIETREVTFTYNMKVNGETNKRCNMNSMNPSTSNVFLSGDCESSRFVY